MRPLAMFSVLILMALALAAADQKAAEKRPAMSAQAAAIQPEGDAAAPAWLISGPQKADDSPLVAAAKLTKRGARKSTIVITNETLAGKGAHVTTTASQHAISVPPPPPDEWSTLEEHQVAAEAQAKIERETEARKRSAAEQARKKRMAQLAASYEDDWLAPEGDPAQVEHDLATQLAPPTQPAQPPQKP